MLSKQSIWANTSAISSFSFCGHTCKGWPGGQDVHAAPALPRVQASPFVPYSTLSGPFLPMPFPLESRSSVALCARVPPLALASGVGVPVTSPDPVSSLLSLPNQPATVLCVRQQALTQPDWELRTIAWRCSPCGFRGNKPHLLSGIPSSLSLVSKCLSQARCYGYPGPWQHRPLRSGAVQRNRGKRKQPWPTRQPHVCRTDSRAVRLPVPPQPASRDCPVQKRTPACPSTTFAGPLGGQMSWHCL